MPHIICHHNGKYNIYTTVSDGFCFESGMSLEQLEYYIKEEYGNEGLRDLPHRLNRAHENGHSGLWGGSLNDFLICNRAGEDEAWMETDDIIKRFLS